MPNQNNNTTFHKKHPSPGAFFIFIGYLPNTKPRFMKILVMAFLLLPFLVSCSGDKKSYPDNSMDAGRDFIRASLDGDFETAGKMILSDEENRQLFESYKRFYARLPEEKRENYKKASYEINKFTEVNDSTTLMNYSNSYMHSPLDIKVVKKEGMWKIDFKYTYADKLPSE